MMGTIVKYIVYILIIIVIYLLGVGFYEGTFNSNSTVGEVSSDVAQSTKEIIDDGYQATKRVVKTGYDSTKESVKDLTSDSDTSGGFQGNVASEGGFQEN